MIDEITKSLYYKIFTEQLMAYGLVCDFEFKNNQLLKEDFNNLIEILEKNNEKVTKEIFTDALNKITEEGRNVLSTKP